MQARWFLLSDSVLVYFRSSAALVPQGVIILDQGLRASYGFEVTARSSEFILHTLSRRLLLAGDSPLVRVWQHTIPVYRPLRDPGCVCLPRPHLCCVLVWYGMLWLRTLPPCWACWHLADRGVLGTGHWGHRGTQRVVPPQPPGILCTSHSWEHVSMAGRWQGHLCCHRPPH